MSSDCSRPGFWNLEISCSQERQPNFVSSDLLWPNGGRLWARDTPFWCLYVLMGHMERGYLNRTTPLSNSVVSSQECALICFFYDQAFFLSWHKCYNFLEILSVSAYFWHLDSWGLLLHNFCFQIIVNHKTQRDNIMYILPVHSEDPIRLHS